MIPRIELHCGDALPWLKSLPENRVNLWLTSPPYEDARTYGLSNFIGKTLRGMAWVEWMRPICVEMARTGRIVAFNAAGKRKDWVYSPVVEWLIADLTRLDGLVCGPAPYAWVKTSGIAGSGSRHYHRRDWEAVYVFGRRENFPPAWSDNTAFGHPPKYKPGGAFSHRTRNGTRANARPMSPRNRSGAQPRQPYRPPKIANPGNIIRTGNGGGQIGDDAAHESEAPMNLAVAERFVRWYCPPGGIVGDPMAGSGTTGHAALMHGRKFLGNDIRDSQIKTMRRRLAAVELA